MLQRVCGLFLLLGFSLAVNAFLPIGQWQTIDDKTKKPRAIIAIQENNGVLTGTIIKTYKEPGDKGICVNCHGQDKGKPIVGLTILKEMSNKSPNVYEGGSILDPKTGKQYHCLMKQLNAKEMEVRGYIGVPLLGRTQTWKKLSNSEVV